jgi:hypothetical protein
LIDGGGRTGHHLVIVIDRESLLSAGEHVDGTTEPIDGLILAVDGLFGDQAARCTHELCCDAPIGERCSPGRSQKAMTCPTKTKKRKW